VPSSVSTTMSSAANKASVKAAIEVVLAEEVSDKRDIEQLLDSYVDDLNNEYLLEIEKKGLNEEEQASKNQTFVSS
jgi:hypothetical protein